MKKLFLLIAMTAFIASCTSKSTESTTPSVDTTAIVMDSTMVDSTLITVEADTSL